jgi:hydrogenase maturation protein HypF
VQGVGFRPTVYRVATALGLDGWVVNDSDGVTVEIEGPPDVTGAFHDTLISTLPHLARLESIDVESRTPNGDRGFEVRATTDAARRDAMVPPDAAVCTDCRHDMDAPDDRRARYPFTTCTNCGPRFSVVHALPYDRARTSMACFALCADCRREYDDPTDRRFHAEPVCCPACGPELWLTDDGTRRLAAGPEAVPAAARALATGAIVAVKGLGGFQIACRADDDLVVRRLRDRKRRPRKPFAVMVRDLTTAANLVHLTDEDRTLLSSPRAPIVLARRRADAPVATSVAPGLEDLGVLLPTTPLHLELLRDPGLPPVVMTSGNRSEEPLCRGNRDAVDRLGEFVDLLLLHDRDVARRIDDSVVRSSAAGPIVVRRARGWVPEPLALPVAAPEPVLAVGGHLQATACVAVGRRAYLSQHIGDLDSESARSFHAEVIDGLEDFLGVRPRVIAADLHPDYPSSWYASKLCEERDAVRLEIQHHVAHAAAVLAEHDRFPQVGEAATAIVLDGTGWGDDGTAWGGEWLHVDGTLGWRRVGALDPIPLVGGERAVREPWRVAAAALAVTGTTDLLESVPMAAEVDPDRLRTVIRVARDGAWPVATGAGRLFEAMGALLGFATTNDWEGEAAAAVEAAASTVEEVDPWPELALVATDGLPRLPFAGLIAAAARRVASGEAAAGVARGFHATFSALAVELTRRVSPPGAVVALGGGCLVNRLLRHGLETGLRDAGFVPLLPASVPPGDGGLAFGQVVAAAVSRARGATCSRLPGDGTLHDHVDTGSHRS